MQVQRKTPRVDCKSPQNDGNKIKTKEKDPEKEHCSDHRPLSCTCNIRLSSATYQVEWGIFVAGKKYSKCCSAQQTPKPLQNTQ